jgi:hypothetical protein
VKNDVLTLTPSAGAAPPIVPLLGIAGGVVVQTPVPLQFGVIPVGTTSVLTLTITNSGLPGTVTVGTAINGPSYKILTTTQNTCQGGITAGQSCVLPVEFNPVSTGVKDDVLTLTPSAGAAPPIVPLLGAAGAVVVQTPVPLQFGTIAFGRTEILTLTITNSGLPGTVTVGTAINGPSYKILTTAQNTCQGGITAGQSCVLPVEFDPVSVGVKNDVLTLTPSAGVAPAPIALLGTAD